MKPGAPRLARWILERSLPADNRDDVSGDLTEVFLRDTEAGGRARARRRYWSRALSLSAHFLAERLRQRIRQTDLTTGLSWLDFKLGLRMLIRYPGLTVVGGVGMAVAIAIGATSFAFFYASLHPTLPLPEGERVVGLENWDAEANNQEDRSLHDFVTWRNELKSVEDLGAFRMIARNLIALDGRAEQVSVAEMTASGFRVARVPPLLGRPLVDDDERKGAPQVVVISHDVWKTRFASSPTVVGQSLRLGADVHTIVGVMPEGFAFPVNHRVWAPLRVNASDFERRRGPEIAVFGRLAQGVTIETAQAELTLIGLRTAAAFPKTHERLRPRFVRYTELWFDDGPRRDLHILQFLITMLVVVVGVNVAVLVYARTATRQLEIAVRTALGASRRRIVAQLFVEALVLSGTAATVGLGLARCALWQADAATEHLGALFGGFPFWMKFGLSSGTVVYVLALTVLGAVIVGVLPAVQATGRAMRSGLSQLGGGSAMRLGKAWTALIVLQVAFAVAVLPAAVFMASQSIRLAGWRPGFAAEEFLVARLLMDWGPPTDDAGRGPEFDSRYADRLTELVRRIKAEPGVSGVTRASSEPGNESTDIIEIDGIQRPLQSTSGNQAKVLHVGIDFFDLFDVPTVAGRQFQSGDVTNGRIADARSGQAPIIVNRTFVQQFLGGGNALGRRVRYVGHPHRNTGTLKAPWYEIVGVVGDLPAHPISVRETNARLYHPLAPAEAYGGPLIVRLSGGDPAAFAGRLQEITTTLDPTLRLSRLFSLKDFYRQEQTGIHWGALALSIVTLSVLLLSAAGIYALMSFTVTRRRKEIGIRVALGADPRRILRSVFSRAVGQLGIGIALGVMTAAVLDAAMGDELMGGQGLIVLPFVSMIMLAVGVLAALGPARRGLRVQPTEALREE